MRLGVLVIGAFAVIACSGDDDAGSSRGGEGATCTDGYACASSLVCFVQAADSIDGVCTQLPASCKGKPDCDCFAELEAQCTGGASCEGITGNYSLACPQGAALIAEGQPCSPMRDCETGLFCHVPTPGKPGVCKPLPSACVTDASCDCMEQSGLKKACSGGWHCSIFGERVFVGCL